MSFEEVTSADLQGVVWEPFVPVPDDRVVSGKPATCTVVTCEQGATQQGFWRVTPGVLSTVHEGYLEFVYIIEGKGRLVSENGNVTELVPGSLAFLPDGWRGRWEVDDTLTKSYTIVNLS